MVYIPAATNVAQSNDEKAQNGFIYDELKKKWVLEQKSVSFQKEDTESTLVTPPRKMQRSRTDDSGVTGLTEFSYDDVAANKEIRPCPSTPQDEGVEVGMEDIGGGTYINDDVSEFHPNTNVERFMMNDDGDESTMFGSVLDGAESITLPPPPPPRTRPNVYDSLVSPDTSMITNFMSEPGALKRVPVVHEDLPFDEDIPFDELPKPQRNTRSNLKPPGVADDESVSDASVDSAAVLSDLNKLSKFVTDKKRSSKGGRSSRTAASGRSKKANPQFSNDQNRRRLV